MNEITIIDHGARAHSSVVGGSSAARVLACPGSVQLKTRKSKQHTPAEIAEWVSYNPETGTFRWKRSNNWSIKVGDVAGFPTKENRWRLKIEGVVYTGGRVAWALSYGEWPTVLVDHKDGDALNNRLFNLRLATNQQNAQNGRVRRTGLKGATWNKAAMSWAAQIRWQGRNKHLGLFLSEQAAHEAYCAAAADLYGEFARAA